MNMDNLDSIGGLEDRQNNDNSELMTVDDKPRTLFLTGFPPDVKHREIHNLFRPFEGYEDSILKPNGVAFASFIDHENALQAKNELNGIHFDPSSPETFRVEFAKQNSNRRKEAISETGEILPFWSPEREERRAQRASQNFNSSSTSSDPYSLYRNYSKSPAGPNGGGFPFNSAYPPYFDPYFMQSQQPTGRTRQYPPCNTIFVSNLGTHTADSELTELFSRMDGFVKVQMYTKNSSTSAFVHYRNVESATAALAALNGTTLLSCDKGPIRIEFAKNKMIL